MSSTVLQASSGLLRPAWHGIDWAGCYRRVRSLQRRIVQTVQRQLPPRVPHGALVRLERSAVKVARCVLRGERSREAPDLPGAGKTSEPASFYARLTTTLAYSQER